jgi:hypothetical protein
MDHAPPGAFNVVHKRCEHTGCTIIPNFGKDPKRATHCKKHVLEGFVDVKTKKCIFDHCNIQASFGLSDGKAKFCRTHAPDGATDVRSKKCICPRNVVSNFALPGQRASHCASCKTADMIDVTHKRCTGRWGHPCPTNELAGYYGAQCRYCTDDPKVAKRYKVTETRCLKEIFRALDPSVTTTEQLCVNFACADMVGTRAYVDAVLDHPDVRILLEIDERQHSSYAASCDLKRMHAVVAELRLQSEDTRPIAWVRFNPDDGEEQATAAAHRRRCGDAAKAIRDLIESPADGIIYVNYARNV